MPLTNAIVPATLWLWLCWHLHFEWSLNAQYNYGWAVPFLAVFLFWLRWKSRPAPNPGRSVGFTVANWLFLAALLPVRLIEEANPDWRLLSWIFALAVVALTLLVILRTGGANWARHFAFPVCFPLVAVPWPVQAENVIIHALTRAVAYVAVEVAGWLGIGAYQVGNIIQLANGFVGVDEACSGVKTLQAAIMVALFLGELVRISANRRLVLLIFGCIWVFTCNLLRATALVIIAARSGIASLEHWHDLIGTVVLILGIGGLTAAALLLQRQNEVSSPAERHTARSLPWREAVVGVGWLVAVFGATELWYRTHERDLIARPAWQVAWPTSSASVPIAESTAAILRYSEASSSVWRDAGQEWWGFFARWRPSRSALQLVRSHSPEICLPAVGRTFIRELPIAELSDDGMLLQFRSYEFVQHGQPLFVFVCIQENKHAPGAAAVANDWSARGRIAAVLNGERNLGQRLLELAVLGVSDRAEARAALEQTARRIVRSQPTG